MKRYVIANWKLHPLTAAEADQLASKIVPPADDSVTVVLCPPVYFLHHLASKPARGLKWGSQNCFWESSGPYTGEISGRYLKTHAVEYVIVGHSERRQWLGETDQMIARKMRHVLQEEMVPILCVGGGLKTSDQKESFNIVRDQLAAAIAAIPSKRLADGRFVIAYEPTWAIGSGRQPTGRHISDIAFAMRQQLAGHYGTILAESVPVIYGGSVTAANAETFSKKSNIQGCLVGGASLNASEFNSIIQVLSTS